MNLTVRPLQRLTWLNVPAACLFAVLQRTPVLRFAAAAEGRFPTDGVVQVLRSAISAVAAIGVVDALAGATTFVISRPSPISGTVGQAIAPLSFTYVGAPSAPGSFRVTGTLASGLAISPTPTATGIVNASTPSISGTPTLAGSFTLYVQGFEKPNAGGDTNKVLVPIVFNISGGGGSGTSAPAFAVQPISQTVPPGGTVIFSVATSGSPAPTFQWRRNDAPIAGATDAALTLTNVQPANAGSYTVVATNSSGSATSAAAVLTVSAGVGQPAFTLQPQSQTIASGSTVVFAAAATGSPTYQWERDGVNLPGATGSMLVLSGIGATAGRYTVVATNGAGAAVSDPATLTAVPSTSVGRLVNLAIRTNAGTGAQTLIVGFAIGGPPAADPKPLLLRGVGPSLTQFGLANVLSDPQATVYQSGSVVAANDNWDNNALVTDRAAAVGAFPLVAASLDAALAVSPTPSAYTVQILGKNDGTGVALAEIYDATAPETFSVNTPRLINVSARTQVGTGGDILIAGFVIGGTSARTVLIRAIGPTLADFGVPDVLVDPKLQLFSGSTLLRENDDWGGDPQLTAAGNSVGAFRLANSAGKDAVLLVTLPPGSYTAQVSGNNDGTGVALVEVYEVP